jgi:3-dehydro-L-gulonate 2-dehydrogenase
MLRIPFDELYTSLHRAMQHLGLTGDRAALCARLFAETTRDGVYTHGLNRFPRFVETIRNGSIDIHAEPTQTTGIGAIERWDGHRGVGNLNAHASMHRAIALAKQHGIGAVALANTNHWMRGGTYGWQAAEQGLFAICWTNTLANLPAWGAATPTLGNNPLVISIPHPGGHVVLDMAMSQFSYGALSSYSKRNQPLPVDGGFDTAGHLTRDAAAIESSQRALPVGYWKGSGLSLVLDMLAAMLSGGLATHQIPRDHLHRRPTRTRPHRRRHPRLSQTRNPSRPRQTHSLPGRTDPAAPRRKPPPGRPCRPRDMATAEHITKHPRWNHLPTMDPTPDSFTAST